MRYIDIYKSTAAGVQFVTGGCIQTGETTVRRTPIVKSFVMADGSPVVYPAARDTVTMTLELECRQQEAAAIETLVSGAGIILTGLKCGALVGSQLQSSASYPALQGIPCIINGAAEIAERYAKSGIYRVSLPVQLTVAANGEPVYVSVPTIRFSSVTLDGARETLAAYHFDKRIRRGALYPGIFVRNRVLFTSLDTLTVGYVRTVTEASGDAEVTVAAEINGSIAAADTQAEGTFSLPLQTGANTVVLHAYGGMNRPLYLQMTAFRQAVSG